MQDVNSNLSNRISDGVLEEKFESLTLEYSYLLTQQLESQRDFFEKKLLFVEQEAMERIAIVEGEVFSF